MEKMQAVREAAQADQAKAAEANKVKSKEFFALLANQKGVQKILPGSFMKSCKKVREQPPPWKIPCDYTTTVL